MGIVALGVFLLLGLPFITSDYFAKLINATDAVSSASVILDAPSGNYVVLINSSMHEDEDNLEFWKAFFGGSDEGFCFEDISCIVAKGDTGGIEMAESYRSRLPENQMSLKETDSTLFLSCVENERYDIAVVSREFADSYGMASGYGENTIIIEVKGASE